MPLTRLVLARLILGVARVLTTAVAPEIDDKPADRLAKSGIPPRRH